MLIDDEVALREWLVATLEPLCDAEPIALARYVLALVAKDKPLDKLRENCIDRLEVFLDRATKDFVDQLFDVIRNGRYIPEAKKENVQPKPSESSDDKSAESAEILEQQNSTSPTKQENEQQQQQQQQIPSTSQATSSSEHSTTAQQQSSGAIIQPIKRRYPYRSSSGRHHSPNPRRHVNSSSGGANRHQPPTHYRPTTNSNNQRSHRSSSRSRSESPPPAKRTQRSYSHSSTGSSSRSSPSRQTNTIHQASTTNTNFLYKKIPCSDFFENKGYCALGDACPYDHGTNAVVFEQQQHQQQQQQTYYPPYQQYGMPPTHLHPHYHEYNPEAPELKHGPHQAPPMFMRHPMHHHPHMTGPPLSSGQAQSSQQQMMINPQRTLVTVVTNAEPLPLEQKMRQNDSMGMPSGPVPPVIHTKRHVITGPYPNDRRAQQQPQPQHHQQQQPQQQHEHPSNNDSNNHNNNNNNSNNNNTNHSNTNNGYNNRGWKRPWQKPDGSGSAPATLEIRKIPVEFNTISKLNEHFSKFGTVTNVQIAYDGSHDSALVAYATFHEAETAYKNPQPLFNNRFIKIFWHNSNKAQSSGNNNNNNNNNSNQPTQQQQQQQASSDASSNKKPSTNAPNPMKLHWMKMQQLSGNKTEQSTTTPQPTSTPPTTTTPPVPVVVPPKKATLPSSTITKKDAAKKAAIEIHRKKQGLLEEQIQQQKLLLKKLEAAETNAEKESIRSLMKQVDVTIVTLKDSLRLTPPIKSSSTTVPTSKPTITPKISQQDALKQRAQTLQKQLETLRAKTSADMRRAMTSTLGQSSLNFTNVLNENDNTAKSSNTNTSQFIVKNINNLPKNELEEFLKKSGATNIESGDSDNSLLITYSSKSDINKIQKNGLTFKDRKLDISFNGDSSLNVSSKKRTLSETLEDELLGGTSIEKTNNNNNNNEDDDDDDNEPEIKRINRSQTSDIDENEEVGDEEDRLLADNETKRANLSIGSQDEFNQHYEFEPHDLDDEVQLLDS